MTTLTDLLAVLLALVTGRAVEGVMSAPTEGSAGQAEGRRMATVAVSYFQQLISDALEARRTEITRRIACAQRTEQQIRAIVRDEIRLFVTGDES
jgi:hypothetical protein